MDHRVKPVVTTESGPPGSGNDDGHFPLWRGGGPYRILLLALAVLAAAVMPAPALAVSACGEPTAVTLDIGHSPGRAGATSARGKPEYAFNRRFVAELKAHLQRAHGFEVQVINEAGRDIPLGRRGGLVRAIDHGLFLSIHHDSVQPRYLSEWTVDGRTRRYSDVFSGFSLFVSGRGGGLEASTALARAIGRSLRDAGMHPSLHHGEAIEGENRPVVDATNGVFRYDGLVVLKSARVPAVLLEVGIIVNRHEEAALETREYRARAIAAIGAALARFC